MPIDRSTDFSKWEIHGNDYSEPEWKDGGVVSFDGMGLMTFRGTMQCRDVFDLSNIQNYKVPMFGDELVSAAEGFFVSKITKKLQPNHSALFEIEAIGIEPRCKGQTDICSLPTSSCSTEPIETHWNWKNIGGSKTNPLNGATYDDKGKFTGFAVIQQVSSGTPQPGLTSTQPLAGVRSYYAPKQVFRGYFHCKAENYSITRLNNLMATPKTKSGVIQNVRLLPPWMIAEDWLLISINPEPIVSKDGNPRIIKVSYELLATNNEWNPLIYSSGTTQAV